MRITRVEEDIEQQEFAKRAAKHFAENPQHSSYTDSEIGPGCLFALRWGIMEDCVVVMKLDDNHVPTNYQQLTREYSAEKEVK